MQQKISGDIASTYDALPDCFCIGSTIIHAISLPAGMQRRGKRNAEISTVTRLIRRTFGEEATLSHRPSGAPYIEKSLKHISISHGAGYALLAISDSNPVGIDIESPRQALKHISKRILGISEQKAYGSSLERLLDAWTAKEAIFKALGIPELTITDIILPDDLSQSPLTIHGKSVKIHILRRPQFTIALAEIQDN